MQVISHLELSCRICGLGRRVDGTRVPPLVDNCTGHDFQYHPLPQPVSPGKYGFQVIYDVVLKERTNFITVFYSAFLSQ